MKMTPAEATLAVFLLDRFITTPKQGQAFCKKFEVTQDYTNALAIIDLVASTAVLSNNPVTPMTDVYYSRILGSTSFTTTTITGKDKRKHTYLTIETKNHLKFPAKAMKQTILDRIEEAHKKGLPTLQF